MEANKKDTVREKYEEVGKRLSEARRKKDIKQKDAADELGIQQSYLSQIENGKVAANIDLIVKACKLYKISSDWLIFGESPDKAKEYIIELGYLALPYSNVVYALQPLNDMLKVQEAIHYIEGLVQQEREEREDREEIEDD